MRDASAQDTTTPRRGGYDVNGRLFSNPHGSVDGIMNSILRGTAHDSSLPRLNGATDGTPSVNGSVFGEHGPISPPPGPCNFSGCVGQTWMSTPFCFQHLARVRSKGQKVAGTTAAATPDTARTTPKNSAINPTPQTAQPAATATAAASPLSTSGTSHLPRNAVLSSELSTTYMRRKTAPGSGPRPAHLKTPSFLPRIEQSAYTNGAPVTPSSRVGGESPGGSYFASSHTLPQHNGAAAHSHGGHSEHGKKDDNPVNGANTILTPSESPPALRALHGSRKRSRSDFPDGAQQTNGAHSASAEKDKGVETDPANGPSEVNGGAKPPTAQPTNGQDTHLGQVTPNVIGNPQIQTNTPTAQEPPIQNPTPRLDHRADDATAGSSTSTRLGLRLSLLRRIQERDKERANNTINGKPHAPKAAITFSLDSYIYSQGPDVAPLPPPPEVTIMSKERLEAASAAVAAPLPTAYPSSSAFPSKKAPDFVYAHIDPRVHWTRARPKDWHDAKQKEIAARGGRKANFGKAAQRAAAARRRAGVIAAATVPVPLSDEPPTSAAESSTVATDANGGSSSRGPKHQKAPSKPSAVPVSPAQVPSVWMGELPPEVVNNKPWLALLGRFAQDEEAWRAKQTSHKPSGRNKGR